MTLMILRLLSLIPTTLPHRSELTLKNLALHQQLAFLNRRLRRPKLRKLDRFLMVLLSRSWEHWKETLVIVKPDETSEVGGFHLSVANSSSLRSSCP
jgi:hypothetical protein